MLPFSMSTHKEYAVGVGAVLLLAAILGVLAYVGVLG